MPGFGSGAFGGGPFGSFDWTRQSLWYDLPPVDRDLDRNENNRLEKWTNGIGDVLDNLTSSARDFESLRDPFSTRVFKGKSESNTIISIASIPGETRLRRVRLDSIPSDDVSSSWYLEDSTGNRFLIEYVHRYYSDGNYYVDVSTGDVVPVVGACTLYAPSQIHLLGLDYGVYVEQSTPESYQRTSVDSAWKWYSKKGSQESYKIVGYMAGYKVTAIRLFKVSDAWASYIPASNLFVYDGVKYTDLELKQARFDDVAADVTPLDTPCTGNVGDVVNATSPTLVSAIDVSGSLGPGWWEITVTGDLSPIVSPGRWSVTFSTGEQLYLEDVPVDAGGKWVFHVFSLTATSSTFGSSGSIVSFSYDCSLIMDCSYCPASAIRVEMVPVTPSTISVAEIIRKVKRVIPVHVRTFDFIHIVTATVAGNIMSSVVVSLSAKANKAIAALGDYFDSTTADAVPLDSKLTITNVQSYKV